MVQEPPQAIESMKLAVMGLPTVTVAAGAAVAQRQEAAATAISEAKTRVGAVLGDMRLVTLSSPERHRQQ
jgi:hypothetical protein